MRYEPQEGQRVKYARRIAILIEIQREPSTIYRTVCLRSFWSNNSRAKKDARHWTDATRTSLHFVDCMNRTHPSTVSLTKEYPVHTVPRAIFRREAHCVARGIAKYREEHHEKLPRARSDLFAQIRRTGKRANVTAGVRFEAKRAFEISSSKMCIPSEWSAK